MSWINLSNKKVKTKKDHCCHGCGKKYPAGTQMVKNVSVDGGDFSSTYWCLICEEFMLDKWNDTDDGIGYGDIWDYDNYKLFRAAMELKITDAKLPVEGKIYEDKK